MSKKPSGPLSGVKVIELAHIMAGPVCGLMLADMGADVIKVEKVPGGDDTRRSMPPAIGDQSAAFLMMNRNKRCMVINLKDPDGKEVLRKMLKTADVVIENYRKGTMERLGFGYEDVAKENPGIIYCEISGFGRTGPYSDRAGFDLIAQGMSGLMSITGEGPGRAPTKCGAPMTDITGGILGAMGVLAAYTNRLKTGKGQKVDTSLFEAGITHTYWQSAIALATGEAPVAMGSAHPLNAPYQAFETSDGWITIGAANQNTWEGLLRALEAPEITNDARFEKNAGRMAYLAELEAALMPVLKQRTSADWLARLEAEGVPAGPVQDINQMLDDPHVLAREMVVDTEHASLGTVKTLGLPVKFSETPGGVHKGAPLYGQHTREVLAEYGYNDEEIERLAECGAIVKAKN